MQLVGSAIFALLILGPAPLRAHGIEDASARLLEDAGDEPFDEEKVAKVKAAFVLNFLKFTEWPSESFESDGSPLIIAVVGEDPLGPVLDATIRGKTAHGREIEARRFKTLTRKSYRKDDEYNAALEAWREELRGCHAIYLGDAPTKEFVSALEPLRNDPVLLVGDSREWGERLTHLAVGPKGSRIVFYANRDAVDDAPIKVSSKLLKLATLVETDQ